MREVLERVTLVTDNDELRVFATTATSISVASADEPFVTAGELPNLARRAAERAGGAVQSPKRIDLSSLGDAFFEMRGDARPLPPLRLVDIKRLGDHWEVTAVSGGNRVALAIISLTFELLQLRELPPIEEPSARPVDPVEAEWLRRNLPG